jgi:hypothetical protein
MSSSGAKPYNSNELVIQNVYAVDDKEIPIPANKVLITTSTGQMAFVDYNNNDAEWSLYPAISTVNMAGNGIVIVPYISGLGVLSTISGDTAANIDLGLTTVYQIPYLQSFNANNGAYRELAINPLGNTTIIGYNPIGGDSGNWAGKKLYVGGDVGITGALSVNTINMTAGALTGVNTINGLPYTTGEDTYWNSTGSGNISSVNTGNIGIGVATPVSKLEINSGTNISQNFPVTGTYIVPTGVKYLYFEMIAGGGNNGGGAGTGGVGGYIRCRIDVEDYVGQTLDIYVGTTNTPSDTQATASYITIGGTGPLFVIAGAGGGVDQSGVGTGGAGGGGTFSIASIANGQSGTSVNPVGLGGTNVGGLGGGTLAGNPNSGDSRPLVENYLQAAGGSSTDLGLGGYGGGGYCGGGGSGDGGAGGGGSSYYNSRYVTILESYQGDSVPIGKVVGYGRGNQDGIVILSSTDGNTTLTTSSGISSGGDLVVSGNVSVGGLLTNTYTFYTISQTGGFPASFLPIKSPMYIVASQYESPLQTPYSVEIGGIGLANFVPVGTIVTIANVSYMVGGLNITSGGALLDNINDLSVISYIRSYGQTWDKLTTV